MRLRKLRNFTIIAIDIIDHTVYNIVRYVNLEELNFNKFVFPLAAMLCAGELCSCSDFIPDNISTAISAALSIMVKESSGAETMIFRFRYVEVYDNAESVNSDNQTPNNELLKIDALMLMTGKDIRIASVCGEVFAEDLFLYSDIKYINSMLNELYLHYTEPFDINYK